MDAIEQVAAQPAIDIERLETLWREREMTGIDRLLNPVQVGKILGVDKTTVFRMAREDAAFPQPLRLARQTTRWRASDLKVWIASLKPARG